MSPRTSFTNSVSSEVLGSSEEVLGSSEEDEGGESKSRLRRASRSVKPRVTSWAILPASGDRRLYNDSTLLPLQQRATFLMETHG
ncbi:hypothetical protein CRUP_004567 [Coryphaenoides rupestris]|nr:hypothetical protein CRUP_004567 [Coryphaenoides rupestris]